ncbi:MAG TPA: LiaF domain-containing protein [Kofleriaceae bacterium]|nr:LiaF domain-containing protein [Kofleriaceae bacterium]
MRPLGPRFAIGVVVLLIGLLLLFEIVTGIGLPVARIVIACVFLLVGVRFVVGGWSRRAANEVVGEAVLAHRNFSQSGALERDSRFDVVLGRGVVDLTGLVEPARDVTITIEALFGQAVVKLPTAVAYDVEGSSAFGEVRMPDRSTTAMGSLVYRAGDHPSRLHLRVNAVFGACRLVEAAPPAAAA